MAYLLDTNVLVLYVRANEITRQLEADLNLFSSENNLVVSAVTVGEVKSLAIRNNWGRQKLEILNQLLNRFLIASINISEIINQYAEIDAYSQGKLSSSPTNMSSRNMGKNDLWIASTAAVLNAKLISTDKDFAHLNGVYLDLIHIEL